MLSDSKILKDLNSIPDFIETISRRTDGRYKGNINQLHAILAPFLQDIEAEVRLREQLEKYSRKGFRVRTYLSKSYYDNRVLKSEITTILDNLRELDKLVSEYIKVRSEVPTGMRSRIESLMYDPSKLREVKSLWHKIKTGAADGNRTR